MTGLLFLLRFDQPMTRVETFVTGEASRRSEAEDGHQPVETPAVCTKSGITFATRAGKSRREHNVATFHHSESNCDGGQAKAIQPP
jgi:hypothetical protein